MRRNRHRATRSHQPNSIVDTLAALAGRNPDVYTREGVHEIGTVSESGTPDVVATGWQSVSPAARFQGGATTDGYLLDDLAAARNADPDLPFTVAMSFRYDGDGYLFAAGNSASGQPYYGVYADGSHNVGFFARQNDGSTVDINALGASALSTSTYYGIGITYDGSRFRFITHDGSSITERLVATSLATLSAANYTITDITMFRRISAPLSAAVGNLKRCAVWDGIAVSDAELDHMTKLLADRDDV